MYSFSAVDTNGAFAYRSIAEWQTVTAEMQSRFWDALQTVRESDPRLYAQECEFLMKMGSCWRARGMGTLFVQDPKTLTHHDADQAAGLRPELKALGSEIAAVIRSADMTTLDTWFNGAVVRLDKGKGSPYWFPGTDVEAGIATARVVRDCKTYSAIEKAINQAGNGTLGLCQTSDVRIQSASTESPNYIVLNGELKESGARFGPKIRRIAAQPSATNYFWAPMANVMRNVVSSLPGLFNSGTIEPVIAAARNFKYVVAIDLKTYDLTVSLETLDLWRELVAIPAGDALLRRGLMTKIDLARILDIDFHTQRMPIMLPPRNTGEGAWIVGSEGELRSGENPTSLKGTTINRSRCLTKLQQMGGSATSSAIFNYGDDTLLMTNDKRIVDKWIENAEFLGFREESAPDTTFLMKRVPYGYGYLGRMLLASVNREPRNEPSSTVAAASAFATRHALLGGHPLQDYYFRILSGLPGPARLTEAVSMARSVTDPVNFAYLAAQVPESRRGVQLQDVIESLETLNFSPVIAPTMRQLALRARARLLDVTRAERKRLSWAELASVRDSLSFEEASSLIASKSYKNRSTN
jgi:hypothetical protein